MENKEQMQFSDIMTDPVEDIEDALTLADAEASLEREEEREPPGEEAVTTHPEPAAKEQPDQKRPLRRNSKADQILTLEIGDTVETEESQAEVVWHSIHNAYRTRRMLTGVFGGIEVMESGKSVGVLVYRGYRILIPLKEMAPDIPTNLHGDEYTRLMNRLDKRFTKMLGAEIDFVVKGIDSTTHSVVASRKDAMLKKRQIFYMTPDDNGECRITKGRTVEARIVSVFEKMLRAEIFGVEVNIPASSLTWEWIGDVNDYYSVGDTLLVRMTDVKIEDVQHIAVRAEAKSMDNGSREKLKLCRIQNKYAGKVVDVHKGIVFIRLTNGVNAIAHSCYDRRTPGKKDDVSFVVTRIDEERGVAVGLITRIIKQNI